MTWSPRMIPKSITETCSQYQYSSMFCVIECAVLSSIILPGS